MSVSIGIVEFASEFVYTARKYACNAPGIHPSIFTSRQTLAICNLGVCRIIRYNEALVIHDLVDLAVVTTPPEAKKFAEMIALRILLDEPDPQGLVFDDVLDQEELLQEEEREELQKEMSRYEEMLKSILTFIDEKESVDLSHDLPYIRFANQIEQEIYGVNKKDYDQYDLQDYIVLMRKRISFEIIGGRKGVIGANIDSWFALNELTRRKLLQTVSSIENEGLIQTFLLGLANLLEKYSREEIILHYLALFSYAGYYTDRMELKTRNDVPITQIQQIIKQFSHSELMQAINLYKSAESELIRYGISSSKYSPNLSTIIEELEDYFLHQAAIFDDVLTYPDLFQNAMDRQILDNLIENSMDFYDSMELLQKAHELDEILHTNLSERLHAEHAAHFEDLTANEILNHELPNFEWIDLVEQKSREIFDDQGKSWDELVNFRQDLIEAQSKIQSNFIEKSLGNLLKEDTEKLINLAEQDEQLEEAVEFAREHDISLKPQQIRARGKELGMDDKQIAKLLGSLYDYLKNLIQDEDPSYYQVKGLLDRDELTHPQAKEIIQTSVESQKLDSLGAFSEKYLPEVIDQIPQTAQGQEMLSQALGAGGGPDMLFQWFALNRSIPPLFRDILKNHAKQILIQIAKSYASSLIGSSDAGPLPEGSTRPYVLGDDPNSIDLEETIENILDSGKRLKDLVYDDFIVRKEVTGRRCVVFLVDVSGSMGGEPLGCASIVTAMLLMAFGRDELGVALFESNTHIICNIHDTIEIDDVVDEILELKAMGGTQMKQAIRWANTQFEQSHSEDKIFIMVTDAMLGDFTQSRKELQHISNQNARAVMIVPNSMTGIGNIQQLLQAANSEIIQITDWQDFPEIVSKILSNS